jgi:small GTP-binding protein
MSSKLDITIKCILLGNQGSGKSSFIKRYMQKIFNKNFSNTIGVDFASKIFSVNNDIINDIVVQFWDTAGQEIFYSITQLYYRDAHFIFLFYDITNQQSFTSLTNGDHTWVKKIEENTEYFDQNMLYPKVVLIGNKHDLAESRKISVEDAAVVSNKYNFNFFETSAKSGHNIENCVKFMVDCVVSDVARYFKERFDDKDLKKGNIDFTKVVETSEFENMFKNRFTVKIDHELKEKKSSCCYNLI